MDRDAGLSGGTGEMVFSRGQKGTDGVQLDGRADDDDERAWMIEEALAKRGLLMVKGHF